MDGVADLSELCRLCLDSSIVLFPLETTILYTTHSLPQVIKFCTDIDCNSIDDGISPKNICQGCLEKLQIVYEFKSKSQESDKYLKQIISHSTVEQAPQQVSQDEEPVITPYNAYPEDDDDLLQPMSDYEQDERFSLKRGQKSGEFQCKLCLKTFKYIKPLKNHMKLHKTNNVKKNYYQSKKLAKTILKSKVTIKPGRPKKESQARYDSVSPYNTPQPYDIEPTIHTRDSSPDFGAMMLSTSEIVCNEILEEETEMPKTSRTGRVLKKPTMMNYQSNGHKRAKIQPSIPPKKTPTATPARSEPPKKVGPGPLSSKTRPKPAEQEKPQEGFQIEGFSEVDISKMLKKSKKRSNMIHLVDDDDDDESHSSIRSRSRSVSVELIPEIDIFGRG